jgi:signal transduction histidine kinase
MFPSPFDKCFLAIRLTLLLTSDPALILPFLPVLRWSQLFWLLQVLCLFLAWMLLPTAPLGQHWLGWLRVFLDSLLLMSAVTLLCWYFLLFPLYLQYGSSLADPARVIASLGMLFILIVWLTREHRLQLDRLVLGLLILSVLLVLIGNLWAAVLGLHTLHASSATPDAFWLLGYLVLPLAGLVQFRLVQWGLSPQRAPQDTGRVQWRDLLDCLRFMLPFVVPLLVSAFTILESFLAPTVFGTPIPALIVSAAVLTLMIVRQGVLFLQGVRLRREQAAALARELALAETNRQMETFVTMASHELKTPLTVMTLHQQWARRRLQRLKPQEAVYAPEVVQALHRNEQDLLGTEAQLKRQGRLINELLDVSRIQVGRLDLHLEPGELQAIVRVVVEEQREAWPERSIQLYLPAEGTVPIEADPDRIGQVVTNFLTNALRYSAEDRPVEVGVYVEGQEGRVWVRDQGPGLPPEECEHIWERFYRAPGIVGNASMPNGNPSFIAALAASIAATHPDAVFYGGVTQSGAGLLKAQLVQRGYTGPFVGGDGITGNAVTSELDFIKQAGANAADGTFATNPYFDLSFSPSAGATRFIQEYSVRYPGEEDLPPYTAEAYDAAMVLITAIKQLIQAGHAVTRAAMLEQVQHIQYTGVIGPISFDEHGDIAHGVFTISTVRAGQWVYYQQVSA